MSVSFELLKFPPIITAVTWYTIVAFQVRRDRIRTWTESFFISGCFFVATYALSDFYFFQAGNEVQARLAAGLSLSSVTLASTFFLLFSKVYLGKMRYFYLIALLPPIIFAPFFFSPLFLLSIVRPQATDPWVPHFEPSLFGVWALVMAIPAILGLYYLFQTHRIVKAQNPRLGRRTAAVFGTLAAVVFSGLFTNALFGTVPSLQTIPPPFSSLLAIPGAMTIYALAPISRERVSEVLRRFRARQYSLEGAFLVYNDGTVIASRGKEATASLDQDIFAATLDVIQNFMRTSFPILKGTSLRTIEHGNFRMLIERGRFCYLTLILTGEENDLLRRQMRDELLAFESANSQVLRIWKGISTDAVGAEDLFQHLFQPSQVFGA